MHRAKHPAPPPWSAQSCLSPHWSRTLVQDIGSGHWFRSYQDARHGVPVPPSPPPGGTRPTCRGATIEGKSLPLLRVEDEETGGCCTPGPRGKMLTRDTGATGQKCVPTPPAKKGSKGAQVVLITCATGHKCAGFLSSSGWNMLS
jgi:hypothetical protein